MVPAGNNDEMGDFFGQIKSDYRALVESNLFAHFDFIKVLKPRLKSYFELESITVLDLGCADAWMAMQLLQGLNTEYYMGIDASEEMLESAAYMMQQHRLFSQFIHGDMRAGIRHITQSPDLILLSYSLHHLETEQKLEVLLQCHKVIRSSGRLMLVDILLPEHQDRDSYLSCVVKYLQQSPYFSKECAEHVQNCDLPETLESYIQMARSAGWSDCHLVLETDFSVALEFIP